MNCSTVRNSLIRVDGFVGLFAIEVVGNELLDSRDTGGATNKNDFMDFGLVNLGICQNAVNGGGSRSEEILAKFLEPSTGDGGIEIDTLVERVDFNGGLCGG